ncbi:protein of unknown function [Pseudomonas sp. JV551A1]|uniref:Uncharacterized protein n=1 Tax=Pseudomonas inefficax TaxID=2078786 RepID=A0AAQ1SVP5_9PSED|nr:protein of unknown function [Pseudomonas sp. JV551A1]SPO63090.1 protein of unknown function [Pseudomonas inefficax]
MSVICSSSVCCVGLFAGKPAPTGTAQPSKAAEIPVGAGLPAKRPAQRVNVYNPYAVWLTAYPPPFPPTTVFLQLCRFRHSPCRKPSRTVAPIGPLYAPRKPPQVLQERGPKSRIS